MSEATTARIASSTPFRLRCGSREQFVRIREECEGRILGVLAYAETALSFEGCDFPCTWVALPMLGCDVWYEIWISNSQVTYTSDAQLAFTHDGQLLFGTLVLDETSPDELEAKTFEAYSAIFNTLDHAGYPELLRVWNYFTDINATGRELERYREFNAGRHDAFRSKGRVIREGCLPAACALGTRQGSMVVCFLAGQRPGIVVENSRQTNAYRYPETFGPKSPTFSRGILLNGALLISGTASIVGSSTLHPEDVMRQLGETIVNLNTVIDQARLVGFSERDGAGLCLIVYLRYATDYAAVRRRLTAEFGRAHVAYLQADVCRKDLLVEIEAFWIPE
jgi:enamine deaminase RidA (YjgF/YER057c/UK114 family)